MRVYINFANDKFKKHQKFSAFMAKYFGKFDKVICYNPEDIDDDFYKHNHNILKKKRGAGYWLWKPYFIFKTLKKISYSDYLFYSDSGAFFLKRVDILINELTKYKQDIMGFELPLIEEQWTKKELFKKMECNSKKYTKSNQIMASFILIRKSNFSVKFFKEFIKYAVDEINIMDKYDKSTIQKNNFIDHRHDQSIFSLLYKKYNLRPFKDPSQFGKYPRNYSKTSRKNTVYGKLISSENGRSYRIKNYKESYDNIIYHCRIGSPIKRFIKFKLLEILASLNIYDGCIR
jgi:hypothetical protein